MLKLFSKRKYRTLNKIQISATALRHNLNLYRQLLPNKTICPVLKANAYGHGLIEVAQTLKKENPEFLIVDSLYEAYKLKKANIHSKILILGYTITENIKYKHLPFHFAVSDFESAQILAKKKAKVHLKIDTGMNRMGFTPQELATFLPKFKEWNLDVKGVLTHLADPDNPQDNSFTEKQLTSFKKIVSQVHQTGFKPKWIHAGQSAGSLKQSGDFINMVRLGIGFYGINPFHKTDPAFQKLSDLKPALELISTLVGIRKINKNETISYGRTFKANRKMTIGIVPVGYYEALPWNLANKGFMEVKNVLCPIIGKICMNYTIIDLSKVKIPQIGDAVIIYSQNIKNPNSIIKMAKLAKTLPYELLTRINQSIRREII